MLLVWFVTSLSPATPVLAESIAMTSVNASVFISLLYLPLRSRIVAGLFNYPHFAERMGSRAGRNVIILVVIQTF